MSRKLAPFALVLAFHGSAQADPQLSSWYTQDSGKYARLFTSSAAETAGTPVTTWSRGSGTENAPSYTGVQEISYSDTYVYVRTTGLPSHLMGPWYLDAAKTQNFPNFPGNTNTIYRIPRHPAVAASKTATGLGASGFYVNGVAMFDMRDAFSYRNASAQDATPVNGLTGDGIWNREAYHNEGVTFDAGLAHQAGEQYHYHAQPPALRYQLGDHVNYDAATNRYTESAAAVTKHSPILAWAADGLPVYGPYGYTSPLDPNSGLKRMTSGFVLRNGQSATTNLSATGRTTLPAWAARVQGRSATLTAAQQGPAVNATYALGHYLEDYDYLGDLGKTQGADFDLNEQNARWCVTPEFPAGTWAYFSTITETGVPVYPYSTGRQYYGTVSGGTVTSVTETVTSFWKGGPDAAMQITGISRNGVNGAITPSWSSVEGGVYKLEGSADLTAWTDLTTNIASGGLVTSAADNATSGTTRRFYRVTRTSVANYDSTGNGGTGGGGGGGGSGILSVSPAS
ncbi:MAG TPA: YHYH protein, partial [Verrucomicrobiales bacterium]|nr:YHYH protein [Verrucomicrobiales bacterium]